VGQRVFINYRGEDSRSYAALLHLELSRHLGDDRVFLDTESIAAGADYVSELLEHVRGSTIVLAVIGPRWLAAWDSAHRRRIDDPADWIRRELAEAFRYRVHVVPVLTDDAALPAEADLPTDISALSRCQFRRLRYRDASRDVARIVAELTAPGSVAGTGPGCLAPPISTPDVVSGSEPRPRRWSAGAGKAGTGGVGGRAGLLRSHRVASILAVCAALLTVAVVIAARHAGSSAGGSNPSASTGSEGPGSNQPLDLLRMAPGVQVDIFDVPTKRFGVPDSVAQQHTGYAGYVHGVELQDGSRPALEVAAALPWARGTPGPGWVGMDFPLARPLSAGDAIDILAGLPRGVRPELQLSFVVECTGGELTELVVATQWTASGRDLAPRNERVALTVCAGATHVKLVVAGTESAGEVRAIWARAIIAKQP
jgi:hypothetical protein